MLTGWRQIQGVAALQYTLGIRATQLHVRGVWFTDTACRRYKFVTDAISVTENTTRSAHHFLFKATQNWSFSNLPEETEQPYREWKKYILSSLTDRP